MVVNITQTQTYSCFVVADLTDAGRSVCVKHQNTFSSALWNQIRTNGILQFFAAQY